jgi:hypothetical protein
LARGYANTRYLESNSHPETDKVLTASYNWKGYVDTASSRKRGTCAHTQS